jgi:hypothetical protein
MALGKIEITSELIGLEQLQKDIGQVFGRQRTAVVLKAALQKAIKPAEAALKQITPVGPTGNLRRAIKSKVVVYLDDGVAVAVLGFRRAARGDSESAAGGSVRTGPDRARHQWWLEEGTQARQVMTLANKPYGRKGHLRRIKGRPAVEVRPHIVQKGQGGYIASSYNKLGPFKMIPTDRASGRVQTDPGSPRAFFKKSKNPITIPAMPAGGSSGLPPLQTAWDRTQATVGEILQRELRISLEQAISTLTRSATGSID